MRQLSSASVQMMQLGYSVAWLVTTIGRTGARRRLKPGSAAVTGPKRPPTLWTLLVDGCTLRRCLPDVFNRRAYPLIHHSWKPLSRIKKPLLSSPRGALGRRYGRIEDSRIAVFLGSISCRPCSTFAQPHRTHYCCQYALAFPISPPATTSTVHNCKVLAQPMLYAWRQQAHGHALVRYSQLTNACESNLKAASRPRVRLRQQECLQLK